MQEKREMGIPSLGQEDLPEEEVATHSSVLACRISWMEEPGGLQSRVTQSQTRLKGLSVHAHEAIHVGIYFGGL